MTGELMPWLVYLLIVVRLAAFFSVVPLFSRRGIPVMLRVGVALMLAYFLQLSLPGQQVEVDLYILLLAKEVLTGLALGFPVLLYLSLFQMAGQFMDIKAGQTMSAIFDPGLGGQITHTGQFIYMMAIVFYLAIDGHHQLIRALAESLRLIPLEPARIKPELGLHLLEMFGAVFRLAFQISLPVILVLVLLDIALGLLSKTVPQFHVFMEGLPLKVVLSMALFSLVLPFLGGVIDDIFQQLSGELLDMMRSWL